MADVMARFTMRLPGPDGRQYTAQACGRPIENGRLWEGWIEFRPDDGGLVLRTRRETEQPNRVDLLYWASGLTAVYLEGALARALSPAGEARRGPAPEQEHRPPNRPAAGRVRAVLDPFRAARQGQDILGQELRALDAAHLRNIVRAYELADASSADLQTLSRAELADLITGAVQQRLAQQR